MSHKLAIKIARMLRTYGFTAIAVGSSIGVISSVVTDASDADLAWITMDCIMGGV